MASSNEVANDLHRPSLYGVVEGFYGRPWNPQQRKELFKRMKKFGLNTYMYAPKDDFKHRAYWRELYSVEEADQLISLISSAKENGIIFYYAISPGLDITFSNPKEIACLTRKLDQVRQFGCEAFALLFDDIEPEISETDKEVFSSFGHAQVSITNEVYQALGNPSFMICPTEYCTTRAVPSISNSDYLRTIGTKLLPEIDIMWTGNKVISKYISASAMQELSEVLKRKPIIWDNIHANDYDPKRIFLGPYNGRSTEMIPYIRGVLTNPNCEFESNFVAIHTIAQWSKCEEDARSEPNSLETEAQLEIDCDSEEILGELQPKIYHPRKALRLAIQDWLPEFHRVKVIYPKPSNLHLQPPPSPSVKLISKEEKSSCELIKPGEDLVDCDSLKEDMNIVDSTNESLMNPITKELTNSLITETVILQPIEPMDCGSVKNSSENIENLINQEKMKSNEYLEAMQTECEHDENLMTYEDTCLLVDLFYLPFEHGSKSIQILNEFNWLKNNSHVLAKGRIKKSESCDEAQLKEWAEHVARFELMSQSVKNLLHKLLHCKNRCLAYELYPYVWDVRNVLCLLNAYVKWLSLGKIPLHSPPFVSGNFTWFSKGYKEAFSNGEQEPWIFRGGLSGDLQRLLPIESVNDLFLYKPPEVPTSYVYNIRPYLPTDESSIYEVCRKIISSQAEIGPELRNHPHLLGDRFVGSFLADSPGFCFVVEDDSEICGYLLCSPNAQQFHKHCEVAWLPELCVKYPLPNEKIEKGEPLNSAEKMILQFHEKSKKNVQPIPACVYKSHPSVCQLGLLDHIQDHSLIKRLMTCLLVALKASGSNGLFSVIDSTMEKQNLEHLFKLGFQEIQCFENAPENEIFMGRMI